MGCDGVTGDPKIFCMKLSSVTAQNNFQFKLWPIEQKYVPLIAKDPCCALLISLAPQPTADKFSTKCHGESEELWELGWCLELVKLDPGAVDRTT